MYSKTCAKPTNACPTLTARAVFALAHILDQKGQDKTALLFYNACIELREVAFETPHPDLTRAYFFAARCADRDSSYGPALYYWIRAMMNQRQVLAITERAADMPTALLRTTREETAAAYIECARALGSLGDTWSVVALYPAAVRLCQITGDESLARTAATLLFNHLLSFYNDHNHSALLFSVSNYLEKLDARDKWVRRSRLPGMVHHEVRLAQEMLALKPPRLDLAKRLLLWAVALEKIGGINESNHFIPEMIITNNLSNEVANLKLPGGDFWPVDRLSMPRAELLKHLEIIAPAVDLDQELPDLQLNKNAFPAAWGDLTKVVVELKTRLPIFLKLAKRPTSAQLVESVNEYLKAH